MEANAAFTCAAATPICSLEASKLFLVLEMGEGGE